MSFGAIFWPENLLLRNCLTNINLEIEMDRVENMSQCHRVNVGSPFTGYASTKFQIEIK